MRTKGLRIAAPVVAALIVAVLPFVVTDRFLLKVFTFVGLNVLVVTGLALLFGYAGQVSLGHAAFVGLGAYTCAILTTRFEVAVAARVRRGGRCRCARRAAARAARACGSRGTTSRWRRSASAS